MVRRALIAAWCAVGAGAAVPTPAYDTAAIVAVDTYPVTIGGRVYSVSTYRNDAYRCGRRGTFPFVVLEPAGTGGEERPLWVLLHGGGTGHYDADGRYDTTTSEANNDAEPAGTMLGMPLRHVGADGSSDTFLGDRIRAGDRIALGSLCDHDLYVGLGQPYPHNPHHDDTVDGLLANLAMVDAVVDGAAAVPRRPTSSLWILGASAGSFGAYTLAHNLWARGVDVAGVVLDSGLLVDRLLETPAGAPFLDADFVAKHGPYVGDRALWIDHAIAAGFDVPLFDTVQSEDRTCGGRDPLVPAARPFGSNCDWVHDGLATAIAEHGDPRVQQVHVYAGHVHTAADRPGTDVQDDLRAWFRTVSDDR